MSLEERPFVQSPKSFNFIEIPAEIGLSLMYKWSDNKIPRINFSGKRIVIFYAALYSNSYYAVIVYSTPKAVNRMIDGYHWLELREFVAAPDAPKFTASWMVGKSVKSIINKFPSIYTLVGYSDINDDSIYKAANWSKDKILTYTPWDSARVRTSIIPKNKTRWMYQLKYEK